MEFDNKSDHILVPINHFFTYLRKGYLELDEVGPIEVNNNVYHVLFPPAVKENKDEA